MTRMLGIALAASLSLSLSSPSFADDLTLRDVIELHRSGLGDDLLIAVIEADGGPFRLSFADIHDLASDGLSERVITALVRTGVGRPEAAGATAPVVQVQQEVVNYVAPAVVVLDTPYPTDSRRHAGRHDTNRSPDDHADSRRHRSDQPPPAMWMTRQSDGRNVTADGEIRRHVPPAAWVTPRDPKPDRPRTDDAPRSDDKPRSRR